MTSFHDLWLTWVNILENSNLRNVSCLLFSLNWIELGLQTKCYHANQTAEPGITHRRSLGTAGLEMFHNKFIYFSFRSLFFCIQYRRFSLLAFVWFHVFLLFCIHLIRRDLFAISQYVVYKTLWAVQLHKSGWKEE